MARLFDCLRADIHADIAPLIRSIFHAEAIAPPLFSPIFCL